MIFVDTCKKQSSRSRWLTKAISVMKTMNCQNNLRLLVDSFSLITGKKILSK